MGIGTIVSSGLGSYFNTKNAMEEKEALRVLRQREQERHAAWQADRKHAENMRGERDVLYTEAAGIGSEAPSFVAPAIADMPAVERPKEPEASQEDGGIDQGNGVKSYGYGVKPVGEAFDKAQIDNSGKAVPLSEYAGVAVGNHPPAARQNVELDQPAPAFTPKAPAATMASRGILPEEKPVNKSLDFGKLTKARDKLNALRLRAVKLQDAGALSYLNEQGRALIGQWSAAFPGDPTQDPYGYAKHLGQVKAVFGEPLSAEEASRIYNANKAYEAEGATEALKALHSGNREAAIKAYDKGKHRVADVQLTPAKSSAGLPSYNVTIKNLDGTTETFNAFDAMMSMAGAEAQLKAFIDQQKLNNDTRKTDADVIQSRAAAGASSASAAANRANAAQTNFETEYMKKNGIKPGASGGGSDKSAELLNKYSGWFKSSLQIGDTMMSDIDPNEAAKRQAVYERAMGIAQDALARGETPSYAAVMSQARGGGGGSASGSWKGWSATPK